MSAFAYERDEWRSGVAAMTELQRVQACEHDGRQGARPCPDCGDEVDP